MGQQLERKNTLDEYENIVFSKIIRHEDRGFEVADSELRNDSKDFQKTIIRTMLRKGRCACFADCGMGKTKMQLEISRILATRGVRSLILCPLAVAGQTVKEAEKFGIDGVRYFDNGRDAKDCRIVVTNYDRLAEFDPADFGCVHLDECFAPNTMVDVESRNSGSILKTVKAIKDIRVGDRIYNAFGVDAVADIHRREVPYAVAITISGKRIECSPNHPFFTNRGWVAAQDLEPGDYFVPTESAMRLVRGPVQCGPAFNTQSFLREVLLSEMANDTAGDFGKSACAECSGEAGGEKVGLASVGQSFGIEGNSENNGALPVSRNCGAGEDIVPIETDRPQTFRAWRERQGDDRTATVIDGVIREWVGERASCIVGATESQLSDVLQDRLSQRRDKSRYRGGWVISCGEKADTRREKGFGASWVRVDSLEVYKPSDPRLDQWRDADGKLYFYDIGATRHPSFSVHGCLVHNSSILKAFSGTTKKKLIEMFGETEYRFCWSATPAPNDTTELGNHSEFLGVLPSHEMLARWFTNDSMAAGNYSLKGHAAADFWQWVTSWAISVRRPSDVGGCDDGYILPALNWIEHRVPVLHDFSDGQLIPDSKPSATELPGVMRRTIGERVAKAAAIVAANPERQWAIWCELNEESEALAAAIPGAVEVRGSMTRPIKEQRLLGFSSGEVPVIVTKPDIAGYGLNWQQCSNVMFVGLSYSYEKLYQAIRRHWRFGQKCEVDAHVITTDLGEGVVRAIKVKEDKHKEQQEEMTAATRSHFDASGKALSGSTFGSFRKESGDSWELTNGDCVKWLDTVPDKTVGFSVFSPPFENLYIYSDSPADMGNCANSEEFFAMYGHLARQLLRVTMDGRLCSVHCKDLPMYKGRDGVAGLRDFPGAIVRSMEDAGWSFHSRVTIWKCPATEMRRTKNHGLLHKQLCVDSSYSRQGMADYVLTFRKWAQDDQEPVTRDIFRFAAGDYIGTGEGPEELPYNYRGLPSGKNAREESINVWQRYASPVWFDIRQTNVLKNYELARTEKDEKHICPLQLDVIARCIELWSNPRDIVLSPFTGIGSEGHEAVRMGRRFMGSELKESYFNQAVINLRNIQSLGANQAKFEL